MEVKIRTPEAALYEGKAEGVQLPGVEGSFEVLNDHAPLIAPLTAGKVRLQTGSKTSHFDIIRGVVEVLNNEVVVLVETKAAD